MHLGLSFLWMKSVVKMKYIGINFFFLFPLKIFFLQKDWKEIQLIDSSKHKPIHFFPFTMNEKTMELIHRFV